METIESAIGLDAGPRLPGPLRHGSGRLKREGVDLPQRLFKVSGGHRHLDPANRRQAACTGKLLTVDPPDGDETLDMGQGFVDPPAGRRHLQRTAGGREHVP